MEKNGITSVLTMTQNGMADMSPPKQWQKTASTLPG